MTDINYIGVSQFYCGRSIFITGVTGFVGKVLLEKLLRSCDVRNVFVLVRPKKGKTVEERKREFFEPQLFERIKEEKANVLNKVVFLAGDICKENLGLSQSDISMITENVSVVIHCAASVSFSSSLRESMIRNVYATKEMAELCRKIHNLLAFVHVSTAFCNCDRKDIEEIVYSLQMPVQNILKTIDWIDDRTLELLEHKLLNGRHNTYVLTKAMAENLLNECYQDIPWVIVRPSIVVASWKEPIPGWVQGFGGANGILSASLKDVLSSVVIDEEKRVEFTPVDSLVNALLVAAWDKGTRRSKESKVYNLTSTGFNTVTWREIWGYQEQMFWKFPPAKVFFTFRMKTTTSIILHQTKVIFYDYVLAILADLLLVIQGKKMRILKSYKATNRLFTVVRPFTTGEWNFQIKNTSELLEKLPSEDKEFFDFDVRSINWNIFMENYILGIRKFLLKEDPEIIPQGKQYIKRRLLLFRNLSLVLWTVVFYGSAGFACKHFLSVMKILVSKLITKIDQP